MAIKLDAILKRNKSNIKIFCIKNKLTSYKLLLEYCKTRNFIPCSEEEYKLATEAKEKVIKNEEKLERETSSTQKKRTNRTSGKRKLSAPRILESDDNGEN